MKQFKNTFIHGNVIYDKNPTVFKRSICRLGTNEDYYIIPDDYIQQRIKHFSRFEQCKNKYLAYNGRYFKVGNEC